jgi:putative CocE/NonD family hydrolase
MNRLMEMKIWYVPIAAILAIAFFLLYRWLTGPEKVSEFSRYRGYSKAIYDGTQRISDYLTLPDGRKLAYDLLLPTKKGMPAKEPLPVLFKYTPYLRTFTIFDGDGKNIIADLFNLGWKERCMLRVRYWLYDRGHLMDPLFRTGWLKNMLKHGYAVIVVERPGTGASFGKPDMSFEPAAKEGELILNWIASQSWCNGNIGMFGDSFQAMIQFAIAASGNPNLKAIFPVSSSLDNYESVIYRGGIHNKAFNSFFSWATSFLETVVTPVDRDRDGALLAHAKKDRSSGTLGETSSVIFKKYPFRDSTLQDGTILYESRAALYPFIDRINRARTPIYMVSGWYDIFTEDMFFWYENLTVPKWLTVRPLDHSQVEKKALDLDVGAEAHRWFDYWLKGIDNGIIREPPMHYYVMGAKNRQSWQTCTQWPVQQQKTLPLYFAKGRTGSISSVNDGFLTGSSPAGRNDRDVYTVDYTATSGKNSRWTAVNWPRNYPDQRPNDEKALTYTTSPLETDVEVTGHPVVHLWLSTEAPDLDVFVYLKEVDGNGRSIYITEGNLRASHRRLCQAPFNNLGLPYHSHYRSDARPIPPGEPIELAFTLLPTSYRFQKGNRLRIAVTFSDKDNFETPVINPAPRLALLRGVDHQSYIEMPVISPEEHFLRKFLQGQER